MKLKYLLMSNVNAIVKSTDILLSLNISAEDEGRHAATTLTPATFFGSKPTTIKVGIKRKAGPTPENLSRNRE